MEEGKGYLASENRRRKRLLLIGGDSSNYVTMLFTRTLRCIIGGREAGMGD